MIYGYVRVGHILYLIPIQSIVATSPIHCLIHIQRFGNIPLPQPTQTHIMAVGHTCTRASVKLAAWNATLLYSTAAWAPLLIMPLLACLPASTCECRWCSLHNASCLAAHQPLSPQRPLPSGDSVATWLFDSFVPLLIKSLVPWYLGMFFIFPWKGVGTGRIME